MLDDGRAWKVDCGEIITANRQEMLSKYDTIPGGSDLKCIDQVVKKSNKASGLLRMDGVVAFIAAAEQQR